MAKVVIRESDGKEYAYDVGPRYTTTDVILWDERTQGEAPQELLETAETNRLAKKQAESDAAESAMLPVKNAIARLRQSAQNSNDVRDMLILLRYLNNRLDDL
jgi:hypothetical protein